MNGRMNLLRKIIEDRLAHPPQHMQATRPRDNVSQYGTLAARASGPGTELKKLLSKFGIIAAPGCSCNAMAARMDAAGPDGALAMVDDVVAVMKAEAHKRGLPFVETVAAMLVRLAIKKSKRARRS